MAVRAPIFPIKYQIWPKLKQKMNRMQKIIYESKYEIRVIPIWLISHEDVYKIFRNFVIVESRNNTSCAEKSIHFDSFQIRFCKTKMNKVSQFLEDDKQIKMIIHSKID